MKAFQRLYEMAFDGRAQPATPQFVIALHGESYSDVDSGIDLVHVHTQAAVETQGGELVKTILVRHPGVGKSVPHKATGSTKVGEVKDRILDKLGHYGVSFMTWLGFEGKPLEEHRSLNTYLVMCGEEHLNLKVRLLGSFLKETEMDSSRLYHSIDDINDEIDVDTDTDDDADTHPYSPCALGPYAPTEVASSEPDSPQMDERSRFTTDAQQLTRRQLGRRC
jgi:hypothetical protein